MGRALFGRLHDEIEEPARKGPPSSGRRSAAAWGMAALVFVMTGTKTAMAYEYDLSGYVNVVVREGP